ncbi:MAG: gliding motility-associated C-terminal domain-containing protein, partial [Bacteroidota bacterium]
ASSDNPIFPVATPSIHDGTYRVKAIIDGCESAVASEEVEVNAIPQTPTAVNNGPVCIDADDAALRLAVPIVSSTAGATYTWFDEQDIISANESGLVFTLTDFADYSEGDFSFSVQASVNGCKSEMSDPTIATFNTIPANTAFAGEDVTLCETQALELDATQPTIGFGMWEQLAGDPVTIANPDDPKTSIFDISDSGTFIFRWTLTNGACEDYSQDEITILVNPGTISNAGVDIDTCRAASVQLNASAPVVGQGRWTQSPGQSVLGVTISDPFDANTSITGLKPGNQYFFNWEVLGGLCGESSDEVSVVVSNGFSYAGEDFNDCGDGCVNLDAEEPTSGVGAWSSPNGKINFNDRDDPGTLICDLDVGENVLVWTADNGGCGDASRDTVIVNYQPLALANSDTISVSFAGISEVNVIANDNLASASFTVTVMDMPSNGTLEILSDGIFQYQADSNFGGMDGFSYELCTAGCECSIAEVIINVGGDVACANIPSIITPNNDNINDEFIIPCLSGDSQFPENELIIFNQWGDEVYRARDYQNDWRGTYNSEDLPDGTYYYVMNFGDGSRPVSGFFLLQR